MDLTTLNVALIALVLAFLASITAVFKSKEWSKALTNFLLRRLSDRKVIEAADLNRHRLIIKLNYYKVSDSYKAGVSFKSEERAELFYAYIKILADCYLSFVSRLIKILVDGRVEEDDLAKILSDETLKLVSEINIKLEDVLKEHSTDRKSIRLVISKIDGWRGYYTDLLYKHSEDVIRSGKYTGVLNKLDTIFSIYCFGLDVLFKNGVDSFNQLNGELDKLLIK